MQTAAAKHITRYMRYESQTGLSNTASPPPWLASLLACYPAGTDECDAALVRGHSATCVHAVRGETEQLEVWRLQDSSFACFHANEAKLTATVILCADVASFLLCQSIILGKISMQLLAEERYAAWAERQLCQRARA
jgi:hypothetical protein